MTGLGASGATPGLTEAWSPQAGAARAKELFRQAFGAEPAGAYRAPGRVNVIGEHTDYNGGLALPLALPHATYVAVAPREDRRLRLASTLMDEVIELDLDALRDSLYLDDLGQDRVPQVRFTGPGAYVGGTILSLEEVLGREGAFPGFDVAVDSCVPLGAGLSSSAALECAVAVAVDDLLGLGLAAETAGIAQARGASNDATEAADLAGDAADGLVGDATDGLDPTPETPATAPKTGRYLLLEAGRRAENIYVGAPTGGLDQAASLLCREGHVILLDCRTFVARSLVFDLAAAGLELLVIDTRAEHNLADGQYGKRRHDCEIAAAALGVELLGELVSPGTFEADIEAELERLAEVLGEGEEAERVWRRARHILTEIVRTRDFAGILAGFAGDAGVAGGAGDAGDVGALAFPAAELGALMNASHDSLRDDYEVSCEELDVAVEVARAQGAFGARMTGGGFGGCAIAPIRREDTTRVSAAVTQEYRRRGWRDPKFLVALPQAPAGKVQG